MQVFNSFCCGSLSQYIRTLCMQISVCTTFCCMCLQMQRQELSYQWQYSAHMLIDSSASRQTQEREERDMATSCPCDMRASLQKMSSIVDTSPSSMGCCMMPCESTRLANWCKCPIAERFSCCNIACIAHANSLHAHEVVPLPRKKKQDSVHSQCQHERCNQRRHCNQDISAFSPTWALDSCISASSPPAHSTVAISAMTNCLFCVTVLRPACAHWQSELLMHTCSCQQHNHVPEKQYCTCRPTGPV